MSTCECHICRMGNEGNFAHRFQSFLRVFGRGFLQKISHIPGKEFPTKANIDIQAQSVGNAEFGKRFMNDSSSYSCVKFQHGLTHSVFLF